MRRPVINVADAPVHAGKSGAYFEYSMTELSSSAGANAIGANLTRVPPGKAAFPFHHHHANEEHFFVLSGSGVLRVGASTFDVKAQDYIVNLPGGPEGAHQLINTGVDDLVYLAISTVTVPEVVGYPDSGKTGVRFAASQEEGARFLIENSAKDAVGYWEGEDGHRVAAMLAQHDSFGSSSGDL